MIFLKEPKNGLGIFFDTGVSISGEFVYESARAHGTSFMPITRTQVAFLWKKDPMFYYTAFLGRVGYGWEQNMVCFARNHSRFPKDDNQQLLGITTPGQGGCSGWGRGPLMSGSG